MPFFLSQFSNTLGDHMVLQRDVDTATIWGSAAPSAQISTTFNGQKYSTTAGSDGVWRQVLPSTPAGGPYTITSTASTGGTLSLSDVLFGDVYLCGGQSNMEVRTTARHGCVPPSPLTLLHPPSLCSSQLTMD